VAPRTGESGGDVPSVSWIFDFEGANKESIPSFLVVVVLEFVVSNAEPRPPRPNPPGAPVVGGVATGAGLLSFFTSGTGSAGLPNGLEGVVGLLKAFCPNPLDDPKALPDLTAPPDPKGLAPLSAGLAPNAEAPKPAGFDAPKPAKPPVEGTDPNALDVEG